MFIYPLVGNWVWGGGWLQNLGRIAGLGNGAVDFAGSGVVHMIGGVVGLVGAIVIGPRIGRFNKDGSANVIPAHNLPFGILGTIISVLWLVWLQPRLVARHSPASSASWLPMPRPTRWSPARSAGACRMCYMWFIHPGKKPDPAMSVNGMLAGLVAITAPCAFVNSDRCGDHRRGRRCAGVPGHGLAGEGQDR